ncbi:MAG: ABC transporter ATP-binding protein [Lachnospiraceae bacterium]|nr:ABC transporter ATP-binding protein [Lachnospiraceae bacterium]
MANENREKSKELLKVQNLVVEYHVDETVVHAVNDISFTIREGETVGIVGETGAGKTTTALSILRLIQQPPGKIVRGEIFYDGVDLLKASEKEVRRIRGGKITMIFQDPMTSLNPVETVGDQIAEVINLHNKCSKAEAHKRAVDILETVGIPGERFDEYPHQFSGGMKQRVMIAIALACNPMLLIADEPTTALDVTIQAQVLNLMNRLKRQFQASIMMITHDLGVVAEVCDRVLIMYAGQLVETGPIEAIYENTRHPYTVGLFGALPDLEHDVERLQTIEGQVVDPTDMPKGCKFHPRCSRCLEKCRETEPPAVETEPEHFVKCWLYA